MLNPVAAYCFHGRAFCPFSDVRSVGSKNAKYQPMVDLLSAPEARARRYSTV